MDIFFFYEPVYDNTVLLSPDSLPTPYTHIMVVIAQ